MKTTAFCLTGALLFAPLATMDSSLAATNQAAQGLTPEPGKALVVVYRDKKLSASAIDYRPYLNDVAMAVLSNGTWARALVPPGTYDLWLEQYAPKGMPRGVRSRATHTYSWQANEIYFIKVDSIRMPGLVSRAMGTPVETTTGLHEIEALQQAGEPLFYPE